jgi:hypothetical protein
VPPSFKSNNPAGRPAPQPAISVGNTEITLYHPKNHPIHLPASWQLVLLFGASGFGWLRWATLIHSDLEAFVVDIGRRAAAAGWDAGRRAAPWLIDGWHLLWAWALFVGGHAESGVSAALKFARNCSSRRAAKRHFRERGLTAPRCSRPVDEEK